MKWFGRLLPHAGIVVGGMLAVFYIIDRFNQKMGFMTNAFHKHLTFAAAVLLIIYCVKEVSRARKYERYKARRRAGGVKR